MSKKNKITLGEFIIKEQELVPHSTGDLSKVLSSINLAAKKVNYHINRAGLENIFKPTGKINVQAEEQTKLDVLANRIFIDSFIARGEVAGVGSEEMEDIAIFTSHNKRKLSKYVILIDPLDGSKNIDVNVSVGTIFSIYKRLSTNGEATNEDFMQKGRDQVAAGYILYGSSTMMVISTGNGVNGFTLDPNIGSFLLSHPNIEIPAEGQIYSINEGNYAKFPKGVKKLLKYYQQKDEAKKLPLTSRYIGSLVSDFHRNMLKGGIYIYPTGTDLPNGKLRLLYECNPIAFIAEQAGGLATDGVNPILDIQPKELHERCPFFVGSRKLIEQANKFMNGK